MINVNEILLYTTKDGEIKIDVLYGDQNIWLTQKKMALLFGVQIPAINKHLKNIFESGELIEESVISILETTAADGKSYSTKGQGQNNISILRDTPCRKEQSLIYAEDASRGQN